MRMTKFIFSASKVIEFRYVTPGENDVIYCLSRILLKKQIVHNYINVKTLFYEETHLTKSIFHMILN